VALKSNLKVILAIKGMKHGEFAELMGVSLTTASGWITGRSRPTLEVAFEVARKLDVDITEIWRLEDEHGKD
jgi:DNA-binding XRE family transcriptional regulator